MPLTVPFNNTGLNLPTLIVRRVAAQNIPHATGTKIMWDTVINDSDNSYDVATGLYTVKANKAGVYICTVSCNYSGENVNRNLLSVITSSTSVRLVDLRGSSNVGYAGGTRPIILSVGETVRVEAYQENATTSAKGTSGGNNLEWLLFRLNT